MIRTLALTAVLLASVAWPAAAETFHPESTSTPIALPDGRSMVLSLYYVPQLKTYFAGCLVGTSAGGYEVLPPFAHWFSDDATDIVELSQSLRGVLTNRGGVAKFILRFIEYGEECYIDLSGFTASTQAGAGFTTQQLVTALGAWQPLLTSWPGLMIYSVAPPVR